MNRRETEFPFRKLRAIKLNEKQMAEFKKETLEIDKETAKTRQVLEKELPYLSDIAADGIRFRPSSGCK